MRDVDECMPSVAHVIIIEVSDSWCEQQAEMNSSERVTCCKVEHIRLKDILVASNRYTFVHISPSFTFVAQSTAS